MQVAAEAMLWDLSDAACLKSGVSEHFLMNKMNPAEVSRANTAAYFRQYLVHFHIEMKRKHFFHSRSLCE